MSSIEDPVRQRTSCNKDENAIVMITVKSYFSLAEMFQKLRILERLTRPDWNKFFIIFTDASDVA